jgi:hypothetical protein
MTPELPIETGLCDTEISRKITKKPEVFTLHTYLERQNALELL